MAMPIHVCDERCRTLNRDGTIVCRATGRTYGQYVTVDPWNRGEQLLRPSPALRKPKPRRESTRSHRLSLPRIRSVVSRLLAEASTETVTAIVHEVAKIVEFVFRSIATRQLPLVLGALYLMREGVHYPRLRVPANRTLRDGLPCLSHLGDYGLKRASVRVGQNCIERCARVWDERV